MKKKLLILIPILFAVFISISIIIGLKEEKIEYKLIELTGTELINTLLSDEKISITYAIYNDYDMSSTQYLEDLQKTARQAKENIYYVNTSHTTFEFTEIIGAITSLDTTALSYYVFQDGKLVLSNEYKNFKSLYKDLNGKKYNTIIKKTPKKEKLTAIEDAQELYNTGDIAAAYNKLSLAWDTKEAKEHYDNNPYYKILGNWEIFEPDDEMKNTNYINFVFLNYKSKLYAGSHIEKIEGFEKPSADKYTLYDFLIKEDYIYTKKDEDSKYKKAYKIKVIGKYKLVLIEEKTNKTYSFQYGF